MSVSSLAAGPAQVTANVNFRDAPGTGSNVLGNIPESSTVDLLDCDGSGAWCAVEFEGQTGFVSGKYLMETEGENTSPWPRAFGLEGDAFIVLYEPQFTEWADFLKLDALLAAEYRETETAEPIFGVIGLRGDTAKNSDDRTVVVSNMTVTEMDFSALKREQLAKVSVGVGELLPTGALTVPEERIVAGLANYQQVTDVDGLKADPPQIFVSQDASRLVQTDGTAIFAPVQGAPDVEFVVNTNWDLFRVGGALWIRDESSWMTAPELTGPWTEVSELPAELSALPEDGNWTDTREALTPVVYDEGAPHIFYSETPSEMVLFHGPPTFEAVPGGDLEWASNTEADIFRHKPTGTYYYLVSGRWFSTASLEDGPWAFATPDLPKDFQNIPDDVPYYTVRASVPGTSEANEARLRAAIPELARVSLADIEPPTVSYDGEPEFAPIEGTDMSYAVNTQSQVILVSGKYFLVVDGVWFTSDTANGPWVPATQVPETIYTIPPSSPVHNVTYVRVYEYDDNEALYGFTAGYLFGFLSWGVFVHGTGWYYNPYWHHHNRPIYYPRPLSYGGGIYYNPARGNYGRYGYAYGPYRGIEARTSWNPRTGTYARGARVYGPSGSRGFVYANNPRTGTKVAARGGENIYGKWGSASVRNGSEHLNIKAADRENGGQGVKWDSSRGDGFAMSGRRGNTFAGRDGEVYRKVGDDWESWDPGNGWNDVKAPSRDQLQRPAAGTTARDRLQNQNGNGGLKGKAQDGIQRRDGRPAADRVPAGVSRDVSARERANQRSNQVRDTPQRARPAAKPKTRVEPPRAQPKPRQPQQRVQAPRTPTRAKPQRTPTRAAPQRRPSGGGGHRGGGGGHRRR